LDEKQASTLHIAAATLLALSIFPAAWFAVAITALQLSGMAGLGKDGTDAVVKLAWFVGPPVGGFLGLWASGVLVRAVPVRTTFIGFSIAVGAMFAIALTAFVLEGGFTEATFTGGMLVQLGLALGAAWVGRRVAERARGTG